MPRDDGYRANPEGGFTLLEILIALTIFAVAAAGLLSATTLNSKQTALLENKTFAAVIAQNRLAVFHAAHTWIEPGETSETASMAGREWDVNITVSPTARADMEKIEVSVSLHAVPQAPLVSLVGYLGKL